MDDSTPTAYTPNTLTGNLSPPTHKPLFVQLRDSQPTEGGRAVERDGVSEQKKKRAGLKGIEDRLCILNRCYLMASLVAFKASLTF